MDRQSQFRLALCAFLGLLLGSSACEALYGNDRRNNEEYCEQDATCTGEGKRCDPVLHRCTSANVCLAGATYCWDDQAPLCQGDAKPCGGCTDSAQCLDRWNTGYRNGTGIERTTCFKPAGASVGGCAECGEDGRQDMRCPSARPVCIAGSCQTCSHHEQCGSGICRIEPAFQESPTASLGTCVDASLIANVATAAQLQVALSDPGRPFIKLASGDYGDVMFSQSGARILFGLGEPVLGGPTVQDVQPRFQSVSVKATSDSQVTLSRLRIAPSSAKIALNCEDSASLYVRDTVIAGREAGLLESDGLFASCRLVDLQRIYLRRVIRAIRLQGQVQYRFANLGITQAGIIDNTKPLITLSGTGTFAYSSIHADVFGSVDCAGTPLQYSLLGTPLTNARACLDGIGMTSDLLSNSDCFLPATPCSATCRTTGIAKPSLVSETDFFGTSRVSPGTVARCGWYQPPAS